MRLSTVLACGLLVAGVSGCCAEPWSAFPRKVMPDRSCSTGDVHGYDVYIWECLDSQHVVVAQYSAEMTCQAPVQQTAACGATTALESQLALTPAMCAGARPGREWKP